MAPVYLQSSSDKCRHRYVTLITVCLLMTSFRASSTAIDKGHPIRPAGAVLNRPIREALTLEELAPDTAAPVDVLLSETDNDSDLLLATPLGSSSSERLDPDEEDEMSTICRSLAHLASSPSCTSTSCLPDTSLRPNDVKELCQRRSAFQRAMTSRRRLVGKKSRNPFLGKRQAEDFNDDDDDDDDEDGDNGGEEIKQLTSGVDLDRKAVELQEEKRTKFAFGKRVARPPFLLGKRAKNNPFLGKRARNNPFLGKRGTRNPFLGKRGAKNPFLGKRAESFGKKNAKNPFLGKRRNPFLGKRTPSGSVEGVGFVPDYDRLERYDSEPSVWNHRRI